MQRTSSAAGTRRAGILLAALLVTTLTACAGDAAAEPTATPTSTLGLAEQLVALPGVEDVTGQDPTLSVVIAADATSDQILAAAEEAHALATETAWQGELTMARSGPSFDAELDVGVSEPWLVQIYPGEIGDILTLLDDTLVIEQIGGVSLGLSTGWPTALIETIDVFPAVFDQVSATELFAGGGTYSLAGEGRLQIVHVPTRTSAEAVHAVIAIAADYPMAEVILQATTAGPQWPELYVAGVSAEEASAIDARLRAPELADADPEGYPQGFQLTVIGPEGPVYTFGNFGDVPDGE